MFKAAYSVALPALRWAWIGALLFTVGLIGAIGGGLRAAPAAPSGAPAAPLWQLLNTDSPADCPPDQGERNGTAAYWAVDGGDLHLRLCTASPPGWFKPIVGDWSDARYKWWLVTSGGSYLVLVEDFPPNGATGLTADGMGEVTFVDDRNGNGRFSDDWAGSMPPAYLDNRIGSPVWRRAWSTTSGSSQRATGGAVGDVGFALGRGACGSVVDVYVSLKLLGNPSQVCLQWATDNEHLDLDIKPACDTGPSSSCVILAGPAIDTPTVPLPIVNTATPTVRLPAIDTPTATTAAPPAVTLTATSTATALPTEPLPATATSTATATPSATATDSVAPSPTQTATASATFTPVPFTATPTATNPAQPTATGEVLPDTPTATASATSTPSVTVTPTSSATATSTAGATSTATATASATTAATPTATATFTPGSQIATPTATSTRQAQIATATSTPTAGSSIPTPIASATPGSGTAAPPPSPPAPPDVGCLIVCLREMAGGQSLPFPDPATVHAVLLTPWGAPAKPAISLPIGPDGCASFPFLEPGQYRVWVTVPPGWTLYPGNPSPQTVFVYANQPCSQAVFRYSRNGSGPPPFPPGTPGAIPTPPGWPTSPPGVPTTTPEPTPYPASPDRPNIGAQVHLPVLGYQGNDDVCSAWVEAQNVGDRPAKALLIVWGAPGFCPPQCAGPLKVECSGLLRPGSAWNFMGAQLPSGAKSGLVVSANVDEHAGDIFADALCEALFHNVVGNCDAYRRFKKAFGEQGFWDGFDFGRSPAQPLAVEVLRSCPGDIRPGVRVTSSYAGVSGEFLGHWDPVFGGYAFYAPSLFASAGGFDSILYIQNAGLQCTSVELWFKAQNDCLRPRVCDILTLAPGESHQYDAASCMPPGWVGGAWLRSSQPLAIAVDHIGSDVLMTYTGQPAELNYTFNGQPLYTTGSAVAYGPLVYSEYQGWDTAVVVQNLSGVTAAKVKVVFLDRSGGVITTVADWVCPQGTQTFFLPVIASLPGNWVGAVRVESQDWFTPGGPAVSGPNLQAVALLIQYTDIARSDAQEAIAYNLFPEQRAFDWQLGSGPGGLASGVGRIGIPSFLKDWHGTGVTTELAIANVVSKPGFTNFALFIFDQNGLLDYVCESLSNGQVEYINLANWGFINPGFKGSALVSATFWEHEVFDRSGGFTRNLVGLAAVKVERSGTTLASPIPGDESAGNAGFPIPGPLPFNGPLAPRCPGQPSRPPATPTATPAMPPPPGPPPIP